MDLTIDASGKIIAVGHSRGNASATIARFTSAGVLDATFVGAGSQLVDLVGSGQAIEAVALDGAGRIVATGVSADGATILQRLRFDTFGTRETAFGPTKVYIPPLIAPPLALTAEDQLVVAHGVFRVGSAPPYDVAVSRFWP